MSTETPSPIRVYDDDAQAEVRQLVGNAQIPEALSLLAGCEAKDRDQRIDYEIVNGVIQSTVGNYRGARARLVRALRLTARRPERRVYVRTRLASILYRTWETRHGERQLRKALAEVRAHGRGTEQEPWLLSGLGLIHLTQGTMTVARQLFEQALALFGTDPANEVGRYQVTMNLALILTESNHLREAREVLDRLLAEPPPPQAHWRITHVHLADALHALYSGDLDRCEVVLARARASAPENNFRARILVEQYEGELEIARGRARESLPRFEALLRDILDHAPHGDHVPMAARLLATALLAAGRPGEGLERAWLGARIARAGDTLEWAGNLRVAGQCLAALGRTTEAREMWAEVRAVLDATEFVLEQRRLDAVAGHSDGGGPAARVEWHAGAAPIHRIQLADRRSFATTDGDLVATIRIAAESPLPVLLEGETGTGKELVAHLLHELSPRRGRPFVVVDCAALPEGLIEAELFGAARGAFTGAVTEREGLITAADGGTLFLDELPELPVGLQGKLLRVLEDGSFRRVGEDRARHVRLRVIAATNRDVETLVLSGALKPDLFYRLNGYRLQLPALRTQPELLASLAQECARAAGGAGVRDAAIARLLEQDWPGNVRQLEMTVRAAAARAGRGAWLDADAFASSGPAGAEAQNVHESPLRQSRLEGERETLRRVLALHHGNIAAAARSLSMSRQGLHKALRRAGLI